MGKSKRFVVMEATQQRGDIRDQGWEVFDRKTGKRASGTGFFAPRDRPAAMREKDRLNAENPDWE